MYIIHFVMLEQLALQTTEQLFIAQADEVREGQKLAKDGKQFKYSVYELM